MYILIVENQKNMLNKNSNVEISLEDLDEFTLPGADTVVTPTVLTTNENVLDVVIDNEDVDKKNEVVTKKESVQNIDLDSIDDTESSLEEGKRVSSADLITFYKKKIMDGLMTTYDDFDVNPEDKDYESKLESYLKKLPNDDLEQLWDANLQFKEEKVKEEIPKQFYESLPEELQYAAKYVADGGTDMKGLFKVLSQVQEVKELDPETNPREVAEQYLLATNFGTPEEIEEQLDEWEDNNSLKKKANAFKPKLDKMQDAIVEQKLQEQEAIKQRNEQRAREYIQTVQDSLKTPDLGSIKLDNKTHNYILNGLLDFSYDSASGGKTNLLGALIEKHQLIKPNYKLIAEATFLLSDPEGYRAKIKAEGANQKAEEITRKLKTEQNRQTSNTTNPFEQNKTKQGLKPLRQTNIFQRPK